jgi:hypothetical protein
VKGNDIYLIDAGGNFRCIDALLGTDKWGIKNIDASGLITEKNKSDLIITTNKNKILIVSTKLGKIINEIVLASETKKDILTDYILIDDYIIAGFSDSSVYEIKKKQKAKFMFLYHLAPVVSLVNVDNNCLITDYNGNFTLFKISNSK